MIRNLGRTILQRYGYQVLLAEDGQEAVEIYRAAAGTHRPGHPRPDHAAPVRPRHASASCCQIDPDVARPVLQRLLRRAHHRNRREGVLGFVNKPYRPQDLAQTVRERSIKQRVE